ncbi:MAG TPA: hypothetical protein VK832_02490 [Burkholderiaceae bacterium]|nr:hypothetical protein [Burkholderiaceae bacterium]
MMLSTVVAYLVARYVSEPANQAIRRRSMDSGDSSTAASRSALQAVEPS